MVLSFGSINGPHSIVLFEETSAEWMTACIGAMGQSITVATSYATLGMGAVAEALNQVTQTHTLLSSLFQQCTYRESNWKYNK